MNLAELEDGRNDMLSGSGARLKKSDANVGAWTIAWVALDAVEGLLGHRRNCGRIQLPNPIYETICMWPKMMQQDLPDQQIGGTQFLKTAELRKPVLDHRCSGC